MGPKSVCTKNGPTRFSQRQILFVPTMVTLVWRGPRGGGGCSVTMLVVAKRLGGTIGGGRGSIRRGGRGVWAQQFVYQKWPN